VVPVFFEFIEETSLVGTWAWIRQRLGRPPLEAVIASPLPETPDA
jgi:hypothetical protein